MSRCMLPCRSAGMVAIPVSCLLLSMCALLGLAPDQARAARQGPIAAWSFDEGEGETAEDVTGDGHTATLEGATWARGRYGGGLEMDEEGCATVTDVEGLQPTEEFTFEAWLRWEGDGEGAEPFLTMEDAEAAEGHEPFSWMLMAGGEESPKAWLRDGEEPGFEEIDGTAPLPRDAWSHLALTDDGAHLRLYVDGELVRTTSAPELTIGSGPLRIGCGLGYHFKGRIDEVRIYERALSPAEVDSDMEAPLQTPRQGPVAAYAFDEGEGTTAEDLTGDGHTATLEGTTWARGRYGGGLEFDGEEDCVSIEADPELQPGEELTVEAWVRPVGDAAAEEPVIALQDPSAAEDEEPYAYQLMVGGEGSPAVWTRKGGEEGYEGVWGTEPLPEGAWSHLALTDDGAHLRLYVDGELVRTEPAPGHLGLAAGPLTLACDAFGGRFKGRIDELRIYDRAITGAEVDSDMETPLQTPRQGPVAAWSFDEGEGTTVEDVTGDGHEGTVEAPATWTKGEFGGAMEFGGDEGGCVTVPDSATLDPGEEFTIEAWVRSRYLGNEPVVYKEDEGSTSYALGIGLTEFGKAEAWVDGEGGQWEVVSPRSVGLDVWTHLAVTYDGARLRLYVDGEEVATEAAAGIVAPAGEGPLRIGCAPALGDTFYGRIDEVRLYQRALTTGEVQADMEAPLQTPRQGPIAAWSFDEGEGTTVEDLTGDGHTATIHGAAWTTRGRYGGAMEFDAAEESYLSVPDSPELDLTEEFTLEAWVRPGSESDEWAPILAKEMGGGEAAEELAYWLYEGDRESNQPFGGTEPEPGERDQAESDDPLPVDAWSHVALTWGGAKVRLYVDGELVDCSPVVPAGAPPVTEGELDIGGASEQGDFFTGRIDEARVYNRALSEAEVLASMGPYPYAETMEPYGVEGGEAVFSGEIDPHGEATSFQFEYGLTSAYGQSVPETGEVNEQLEYGNEPTEVEEAVEGLEPETTYDYRIVATNASGTVVGGNQTLTTGPAELETFAAPDQPPSFYGTNWNGSVLLSEQERDTNLTEEVGAKFFRIPLADSSKEANEHTAELFLHAAERHVKLLPNIVGIAGGKYKGSSAPGNTIPPLKGNEEYAENLAKWEGQLETLLERYGPEGTFWKNHETYAEYAPEWWEIWNEPNWGAQGTSEGEKIDPARYGELLAGSRRAFNAINGKRKENAKILFGGVLAVGPRTPGETPDHMRPGTFIKRVGHIQDYDGVSVHPYAFSGVKSDTPHDEADAKKVSQKVMRNIRIARGAMEAVRKEWNSHHEEQDQIAKKPIWITEIGWPVEGHGVHDDGHHLPIPEKMQSMLLEHGIGAIKAKAAHLDITKLLYYNMSDNTAKLPGHPTQEQIWEGPANWANHCGLVEDNGGWGSEKGNKREAWTTFQNAIE